MAGYCGTAKPYSRRMALAALALQVFVELRSATAPARFRSTIRWRSGGWIGSGIRRKFRCSANPEATTRANRREYRLQHCRSLQIAPPARCVSPRTSGGRMLSHSPACAAAPLPPRGRRAHAPGWQSRSVSRRFRLTQTRQSLEALINRQRRSGRREDDQPPDGVHHAAHLASGPHQPVVRRNASSAARNSSNGAPS